ncbi:archaellin/type IV pilin N-terminal domain-containing protein [Halorubrum sp. RMP-47]|uniref:Flagellin n=2 Tax=Halorubrum miltondacostae TaxID=3076378 RepID=A0ABD5M1G1_9EURY
MILNEEERGQVGIGTLIVFIAMVLVAAIAAGVLINTAGFLQSQAEATGQESTDLVSERIEVTSSVGIVSSSNTVELDEVRLTSTGAPGADQIDLSETTIQAVGPGGQENLVFVAGGSVDSSTGSPGEDEISAPPEVASGATDISIETGTLSDGSTVAVTDGSNEDTTSAAAGSQTISFSNVDPSIEETLTVELRDGSGNVLDSETVTVVVSGVSDLSANQFTVRQDGTLQKSPVISDGSQYQILLNPGAGALSNTDNTNDKFGQSDSATLDIVSPSGATTSVELSAPDLFSKQGEAVRL